MPANTEALMAAREGMAGLGKEIADLRAELHAQAQAELRRRRVDRVWRAVFAVLLVFVAVAVLSLASAMRSRDRIQEADRARAHAQCVQGRMDQQDAWRIGIDKNADALGKMFRQTPRGQSPEAAPLIDLLTESYRQDATRSVLAALPKPADCA